MPIQVAGAATIIEKKFMARRAFKFKGVSYKNFDEMVPKDVDWTIFDVLELVRNRKIHPFDDGIDMEVFPDIVYMQKRSPLGFSTADMADVDPTGSIDSSLDGYLLPDEIKAASRVLSILARDPLMGPSVQTYEAKEWPYDYYQYVPLDIPAGADGASDAAIPPAGPKPAPEASGHPTLIPMFPPEQDGRIVPNF